MEVGERDIAMQTCKFGSKSKWFRTWLFPGAQAPGPEDTGAEAGQGKRGQFLQVFLKKR